MKLARGKTVVSTVWFIGAAYAVVVGCSNDQGPAANPDGGNNGGASGSGGSGTGGIGAGGGHAGTAGGGLGGTGGAGGAGGAGGCVSPNILGYRNGGCGSDAVGECVSGVAGACAGPIVCSCDGRDVSARCDGIVTAIPFRHRGSCASGDGGPDAEPDARDAAPDGHVGDARPEASDAKTD